MRKILFALFTGLVLLTGSALAQVDCESGFTACQVSDKMFGGARQPAFHFNMLGEADVPLHADIWGGFACSGAPEGSAEGVLHLMRGPINVFIRFDPPIDPGTPLSIIWRAGDCCNTECLDYVIGSDPGGCEDLSVGTNWTISTALFGTLRLDGTRKSADYESGVHPTNVDRIIRVPNSVSDAQTTCPGTEFRGAFPDRRYARCSQAEARRAANQALVNRCIVIRRDAGSPCVGRCPERQGCITLPDPLSFRIDCTPAQVKGCMPSDDPHICEITSPIGIDTYFCMCECANCGGRGV